MIDRQVRIVIKDKKGKVLIDSQEGRKIGQSTASVSEAPNQLVMGIYGLSETEMQNVIDHGDQMGLYAGEGEQGLILLSDIISKSMMADDSGVYCLVTGLDGDRMMGCRIKRTIMAGVSLGEAAREVIGSMCEGYRVGYLSQRLESVRVPRGIAIMEAGYQVLSSFAKQIDAALYIRNGLIYIVRMDEMMEQPIEIFEDDLLQREWIERDIIVLKHKVDSKIYAGAVVLYKGALYRVLWVFVKIDTRADLRWEMTVEMTPVVGGVGWR